MVIGIDGSRTFISRRTGTENYSYQLLKALAVVDGQGTWARNINFKNNRYIVYVRDSLIRSAQKDKWPSNFEFRVIKMSRFWTQIGLALQTFKDNLDVLFVPAHTIPLIRRPGLKTVVTVHDLGSEYLPSMHQVKQRLYLSFMQRYQLKSATKIIAVSNSTKEDLVKKLKINKDKIEVIYEGYDKKLFRPVKYDILRDTLKELDIVPGKYFLFVGTVQPRKNLERLIKAFSFVIARSKTTKQSQKEIATLPTVARNDVSLVIVGSKGWLADDIYTLPKEFGIEKQVRFAGRVEDKFLPYLYSGAIALTFPSLFEGFGLPIIEAQACGCPVITSNVSSMPEVADKAAILVDPYDIESISKAMLSVMPSKEGIHTNNGSPIGSGMTKGIRAKLIKQGFENIKRFSWEKAAKETIKVFEGLK